jgi:type II secretion system protein I
MTRRGDGSQAGFMLLEVILATALLAVAAVSLIAALGSCLAAARTIEKSTVAQIILANKSYEFRVERPNDYQDQEGDCEDEGYPGYTWSRRFEVVDVMIEEEPLLGLWKQTIEVSWRERGQLSSDQVVEYRYLPEKQQ